MSSQSTNDGTYTLTVTFKLGTSLDMAQVLVQNRVSQAMPMLPDVVKATGVTVKKTSPSILLVVNLYSDVDPETKKPYHDQLYLSNYATIQVRDQLARLEGVGDVTLLGQQDYSMRVWLDPNRLASRNLTAADVVAALREQNVQVAAGQLGQQPVPSGARLSIHHDHAGPAERPVAVWRHRGQVRQARRDHAAEGRRPDRAGRQEPGRPLPARRQAIGWAGGLPASRFERARHGRPRARDDGTAQAAVQEGARIRDRLRHHAVCRRVGRRSVSHPARRRDPGGDRHLAVLAGLEVA